MLSVIGGSGLYDFPGLKDIQAHQVPTPFGDTSAPILSGKLHDHDILFLARHGNQHTIVPSEVNFRANIYALKKLGATWCLGIGAVGSLQEYIAPGHVVIPDQNIDWTRSRPLSFFGDGIVAHVSMAEPYCPVLREALNEAAVKSVAKSDLHYGGTIICIEGPQFSSRAESELYRKWGADIIGMTSMPEAKLAREAELAYASLNLVTDYDCWKHEEAPVNVAEVTRMMKHNAANAVSIVTNLISLLRSRVPSEMVQNALRNAFATPIEAVSPEILFELKPILGRYVKQI